MDEDEKVLWLVIFWFSLFVYFVSFCYLFFFVFNVVVVISNMGVFFECVYFSWEWWYRVMFFLMIIDIMVVCICVVLILICCGYCFFLCCRVYVLCYWCWYVEDVYMVFVLLFLVVRMICIVFFFKFNFFYSYGLVIDVDVVVEGILID